MKASTMLKFITLTIALTLGLGAVMVYAYRGIIAADWKNRRCEPDVMMMARMFKPANDPRTAAQFAEDNWRECQKEYVQNAIRIAAAAPRDAANAQAAVVGALQDTAGAVGDVFYDLWKLIYQAYSSFMDRMMGVSTLFRNFMMRTHEIVEQLQASIVAIVFGLMSLIAGFISSLQLVIIVAIVILGILIAMQILLFWLFPPIFALVGSMTVLLSVIIVAVATTVAAVAVSELFTPGACFAPDTQIIRQSGTPSSIGMVNIGDTLADGGVVTAIHRFFTADPFYNIRGIRVTGNHLVCHPDVSARLITVADHPESGRASEALTWWERLRGGHELICLTTTTRRIPCQGADGSILMFADWEEIDAENTQQLRQWYESVWNTLNPGRSVVSVSDSVLKSEAGLSPDSEVECPGGHKRIYDVSVGSLVMDASGKPTRVLGIVTMAGDQTTDAVILGGQLVSAATWVRMGDGWWGYPVNQPRRDLHPTRWIHLYTAAGTFRLRGGWCVRDASDVGMDDLHDVVDNVILGSS
jgi:hypothetical protein